MITLMFLLQIQAFIGLFNPDSFPTYRNNEPLYELRHDVQKMLCYPEEAKEKGIEGSLLVRYTICTDGTIKDAEVLKGSDCDAMRKEACRVVNSLRYDRPAIYLGKEIEMVNYVRVAFALYSTEWYPKYNEPLRKKVYRGSHYRLTIDKEKAILMRKKDGVEQVIDTLRYHEYGDYVFRGRVSCVVKTNNTIHLHHNSNLYNYVNLY